jgi:protein ImuB
MLWACLHFADFSLQLVARGRLVESLPSTDAAASPPLIITTGGNRPLVVSCDNRARSYGIAPGMTVSAAVALASELIECPRDPAAEQRALEGAAAWGCQFTSMISVAPPDALLLEIDGSLRLLGGLRATLLRLSRDVRELGYTATIAAAPTPTAARLLARAGLGSTVIELHALPEALAPLALGLLDQPAETVHMLELMGVRTIGDCLQLPRDGLARRFGQALLDELDRALGKLPDPRVPWIAPAKYRSQLDLPAPVYSTEPLLFAANRLIQEMTGFLCMKRAGITRLKLTLRHEERKPTTVMLGFSVPTRDPQRILRLLRERLSTLTLPDRVEAIVIESAEARPLDSRNLSLFPEDRLPEEERWLIIEHLRARLGTQAVYGISTYPDHRPEHAWRCCEPGTESSSGATANRPLWLLDPPHRLRCDDERPALDRPLTLIAGPERIESGWWDDDIALRDYFVAADQEGRRFWIFRERNEAKEWFLQGVFS